MPKLLFDLQMFADEGMADAGEIASPEAENPDTEGMATGSEGESVAPAESFEELIKGKYKSDYEKHIQGVVGKRLKNQKDLQSQIDSIDPLVRMMAQRYGVQANPDGSIPIQALQSALMDDDSIYEQEAFERGMSVSDLKQMKKLEAENAQLRMQSARTAEQEEWERIEAQAESLKGLYPSFDLSTEMENPQFGKMLATLQRSGFPDAVRTAYEAAHRDEIMSGAMQYAVQNAERQISRAIQSNGRRPAENGVQSQTGSQVSVDPSKLTKKQIDEYRMRAARGEKITFK